MGRQLILVSSITYAIKGRDLLRSYGYKAYIERVPSSAGHVGCGYCVYVEKDVDGAAQILVENGIRVLGKIMAE